MTELINKEELLRRFADFGREIPKDIVIGVIASVKPDRQEGKWIELDGTWLCSYCGEEDAYAFGKNKKQCDYFCPNCGAKMDGERSEE